MKPFLPILLSLCLVPYLAFADDELKKISEAMPSVPSVKPKNLHNILVYSHPSGFKHSSIPTGVKALREMARKTQAFTADFTLKTDAFTKDGLSKYDMIIFNNCTHVQKAFSESFQREAILGFIKSGKSFVGFHSASDGGVSRNGPSTPT